MRLSPAAYERLLRGLADLYASQPLSSFYDHAVRVLATIIRGDGAGWFIHDLGVNAALMKESHPVMSAVSVAEMGEVTARHPFVAHWRQFGPGVVMFSDIPRRIRDRHYDQYSTTYKEMGRHNMTLPLTLTQTRANAASFRSYTRPFTEEDREIARLLIPHLRQAEHNARRLTTLHERLGVIDHRSHEPLTRRELAIGRWLTYGKTNWEIAQILGIAPRTVEKHVENILRKLSVENRVAAALLLAQRGMLSASDGAVTVTT